MSIQEKCRILDHKRVATNHFKLTITSTYIALHAQPGQFVNVRVSDGYDPLLRRPLSIHRVAREHKTFELLYEVVGKGTELLSKFKIGDELDILGPLGTGFTINEDKKFAILVGGGMGVAPLLALAEEVRNKDHQKIIAIIGANTANCLLAESDLKATTDQVICATDDGSFGRKGFVSDVLLGFINNKLATRDWGLATIYACGPKAMLRAISEIAWQKKIDCQISMEARMACGIGTCLGCVIKTKNGYKKVCDDGPVFDASEIVWA